MKSVLSLGPGRQSFDPSEATEHLVATIKVRIAAKDGVGRTSGEEGAVVVAERAAHAAREVYSFFNAQVDSVTLISVDFEDSDA